MVGVLHPGNSEFNTCYTYVLRLSYCDLPHYVGIFIIIIFLFVSQISLSNYVSLLWDSSEFQTFKILLYLRRGWVLVNEIKVKLICLFMLCTPGREWCENIIFLIFYRSIFFYFEGIWCNERGFICTAYWGLPPVTKAITSYSFLVIFLMPSHTELCMLYLCLFHDPPFEPLFPCWGKV